MVTGNYIGLGDKTACGGTVQQTTTECEITREYAQRVHIAQVDHAVVYADDLTTSIEG